MLNISEPISFELIGITIVVIFAIVGLGIFLVKKFK